MITDPRSLDQDPTLPAAIVREVVRIDVLLSHLALPAPSTPAGEISGAELTVRMLPADVLAQCRQQAEDWIIQDGKKPRSAAGAALIIAIWVAAGVTLWWWLNR